ncbi:MAG: hypothetical protein DHS20C21_03050 [Gemmatimonadota bacterium]|nr:MAG: hypothetical protein DHS20C21_03050 [Gemmatimonadota bacterium]
MIPSAVLRRPDLIDDDDIEFLEGGNGRAAPVEPAKAARLLELMVNIRAELIPEGPYRGMTISESLSRQAVGRTP